MKIELEKVTAFGRLAHYHPALGQEDYLADRFSKLPPASAKDANVVSSLLTNGKHAPALDIDVPALLVPSRTEGHSHLYIDVEMTWPQYRKLLRVLAGVGVVEPGYVESAIANGRSLLRTPIESERPF